MKTAQSTQQGGGSVHDNYGHADMCAQTRADCIPGGTMNKKRFKRFILGSAVLAVAIRRALV